MTWFLVAMALTVLVTVQAKEWTAAEYPNPQDKAEYYKCGRRAPSYVCDPDGLISRQQADSLDHVLLNLPKDTMCPCSAWACEKNSSGYIIAVALVQKLERADYIEDTTEGKTGLVRRFAFDLLRKKWRWGHCEETTVIVFSKADGILLTLPGSTPRQKLNEMAVHAIQKELARFFKNDENIGQGLGFLVLNYRHVLDGFDYHPVIYNHVDSGAAGIFQLSVVTSLLATVLLKIFC